MHERKRQVDRQTDRPRNNSIDKIGEIAFRRCRLKTDLTKMQNSLKIFFALYVFNDDVV